MREDIATYKEQHEAFVSNLQGSSISEVLVCASQVPAFIMLLKVVQGNAKPNIFRDFLLFTLPTLLSITVFASLNCWSLSMLAVGLGYYHSVSRKRIVLSSTSTEQSSNPSESDQSFYLTLFKGANVALTCLAILAVDFRIFPRSFGKTETFGVSLMDIGVGAFIFSSAITSKHARGLTPPRPPPISPPIIPTTPHNTHNNPHNTHNNPHNPHNPHNPLSTSSLQSQLLASLSSLTRLMPLRRLLVLGLGFGRLVVLKAINYQEHVSEYGVHWNFFMTLFSVWFVADVMHSLLPRRWIVWIGLLWLSLYQCALGLTPLTFYLFSEERGDDLLTANKEGIVSLNGYIPLYLLAETIAHSLFHRHVIPPTPTTPLSSTHSHDTSHATIPVPTSSPTTSLNLRKSLQTSQTDAEVPVTSSPVSAKEEAGREESPPPCPPPCPPLTQHLSHFLNYTLLRQLCLSTSVLWLCWIACSSKVQLTSRRLCNASYVILVLAMCLTMVLLCYLADVLGGKFVPVLTLQYMNRHSVIVFLAANLLTGLVNNVLRTIYASDLLAMLVLAIYAFLVTVSAWLAEYFLQSPRVK